MFLTEIIELKKKRLQIAKEKSDFEELKKSAIAKRQTAEKHRLQKALQKNQINIIAEIKRASPSKGVINDKIDVAEIARNYEQSGACAISVLTEEDKFCGSLEDLKTARSAVEIPILRKDFIFDEFQIYEAAEAGADVILLIAAMLDDKDLQKSLSSSRTRFGFGCSGRSSHFGRIGTRKKNRRENHRSEQSRSAHIQSFARRFARTDQTRAGKCFDDRRKRNYQTEKKFWNCANSVLTVF